MSRKFRNKKKDFLEEQLTKYDSVVNQFDYININIRKRSPSEHRTVSISLVISLSMIRGKCCFIDRSFKKFIKGR